MLENYPKVYKKLKNMVKMYQEFDMDNHNGKKEVDFSRFHQELKKELTKIYQVIDLYQNHMHQNLYIKKSNFIKTITEKECEKIKEYLQKINLTNKINGFAYFYEVYSIINMLKKHV
jgi:ribosomal protein S13